MSHTHDNGGPNQRDDSPGNELAPYRIVDSRKAAESVSLAELLDRRVVDEYARHLRAEFAPDTASAEILVDLAARSAAGLAAAHAIEQAILRQAAARFVALGEAGAVGDDGDRPDQVLAATMASDILDRGMRFRRSHLRGLLDVLSTLTNRRGSQPRRPVAPNLQEFGREEDCDTYLEQRLKSGHFACPACGGKRGCWLSSRHRWECAGCRRQHGPRAGTVMAHSPLRLVPWFAAIGAIVDNPQIDTADLAQATQVTRLSTVRSMAKKIRTALATEDASRLLAGLDVHFRRATIGT